MRNNGDGCGDGDDEELAEAVICLVLTNAVEVTDDGGRNVGIAVYGPHFSWINHSCSPNACYRFLIDKADTAPFDESNMRILPLCANGESGAFRTVDSAKGCNYGPKVIVRSTRRIKKGEEITVAYTDLLQPKDIRQSELWSKYRFVCSCPRCSASPSCYVDHVLQEISVSNPELSSVVSVVGLCRDEASDKLAEYVDEIIKEYLSDGDPKHCCNKLESLLMHGVNDEHLENSKGKSKLNFRLHPLHHLALNAYTTLSSAYKVYANELFLYPDSGLGHHMEFVDMGRNSAAYSLFLALATYHLYCFEPSLIASVTNFWIGAGVSLLTLLRNSSWCSSGKLTLPISHISSFVEKNFPNCSCLDKYEIYSSLNKLQSKDFESISSELHYCITSLSRKVWRFLIQHCCYLKMFKDLNFSALGKSSSIWDLQPSLIGNQMDSNDSSDSVNLEIEEHEDELWMGIFQLGVHCIIFGGILSRVCFGQNLHLISQIQRSLTP